MSPFLVVVSGLPASGKSTLARRLANDLSTPMVSRDRLRDAVFPDFGSAVAARGPELGPAIDRLVTTVLTSILDAVMQCPHWTVLAPPSPIVHLDSTHLAAIDDAYDGLAERVRYAHLEETGHASG